MNSKNIDWEILCNEYMTDWSNTRRDKEESFSDETILPDVTNEEGVPDETMNWTEIKSELEKLERSQSERVKFPQGKVNILILMQSIVTISHTCRTHIHSRRT